MHDLSGRAQQCRLELKESGQRERDALVSWGCWGIFPQPHRRPHERQHLGGLLLDELGELLIVDDKITQVDINDELLGEEGGPYPVAG